MSKKINEEIVSETEDRPTLKSVNELTAEDVAIKEYLKAVYKTKSKHEVEQLSRQLWNKALAEIIELKEHLDLKDERIEELKQQLDDLKIKITHLESTLQFERSEMYERVRELKAKLKAGDPEHFSWMDALIDEIFPDCAKHTNELNADFRKFAKKTLSGEKR